MALSFLDMAFARVLRLHRLGTFERGEPAIEVVVLRYEITVCIGQEENTARGQTNRAVLAD